ncbi:MAG: hypothetical protein RR382_05410 [Tannerellaceae bacterium]
MGYITKTKEVEVEVDFEVDDYIDEASDKALIDELRKRKFNVTEEELQNPSPPKDLEGDKLKRHLCDLLDSSYAVSHENLLTQLKERLNN